MLADTLELGEHPQSLRETGTIFGTPGYMPPEVLRGQGSTEASDVYSLGVVLYEGVAERLPFTGESVFEVLGQIMDPAVLPPRLDSLARCNPALADLVAPILSGDPEKRPSMDEVAATLSELSPEIHSAELATAVPRAPCGATSSPRSGRRANTWRPSRSRATCGRWADMRSWPSYARRRRSRRSSRRRTTSSRRAVASGERRAARDPTRLLKRSVQAAAFASERLEELGVMAFAQTDGVDAHAGAHRLASVAHHVPRCPAAIAEPIG